MTDVFFNPTDEELFIIGEFIGIEIYQTSFCVKYQHYFGQNVAQSFMISQRIYPLTFLQKFFTINSELPVEIYCNRPPFLEPLNARKCLNEY